MATENHAEQQAALQYESIVQLIAAANCDFDRLRKLQDIEEENRTQDETEEMIDLEQDAGENTDQEDAIIAIQEHPLSVEIRSDWASFGEELTPRDFRILLCTGGPAVQIRGELNEQNIPYRAWLEYQDWGTPWTQYFGASQSTLLAYASFFVFGE